LCVRLCGRAVGGVGMPHSPSQRGPWLASLKGEAVDVEGPPLRLLGSGPRTAGMGGNVNARSSMEGVGRVRATGCLGVGRAALSDGCDSPPNPNPIVRPEGGRNCSVGARAMGSGAASRARAARARAGGGPTAAAWRASDTRVPTHRTGRATATSAAGPRGVGGPARRGGALSWRKGGIARVYHSLALLDPPPAPCGYARLETL